MWHSPSAPGFVLGELPSERRDSGRSPEEADQGNQLRAKPYIAAGALPPTAQETLAAAPERLEPRSRRAQ